MSVSPPLLGATSSEASDLPWLLVCPLVDRATITFLLMGTLDGYTSRELVPQVRLPLREGSYAAAVLDVQGVEFCDLAGLDALHAAVRVAGTMDVPMTLRGASRTISWLHARFPDRRAA